MAFGILEYRGPLGHVPGTSQLEDVTPANTAHLKKAATRNGDVVLVPQPSSDPNDPLNWPTWQKDMLLLLYSYCNIVVIAGIGPLLNTMVVPLITEYNVSFTQVSLLTGYQLCVTAAMAIPVSAISRKYGKRPGFIVSILAALIGTIVCATAQTYQIMLAGRLVQGLGVTQFESVGFGIIGDLYFVHQRGSRVAFFITSQLALINVPSIIAGVVTLNLGFRWAIWILAIFLGCAFILVLAFGWETAYQRREIYNIDTSSTDNIKIIEDIKSSSTHAEKTETAEMTELERAMTRTSAAPQSRISMIQRMKPWSSTYTDESLIKLTLRPFVVLLNPVVFWACLFIALNQVWSVMTALVCAQLFAPPPYSLNSAQLGYLGAGPSVSALITCLVYGATSDALSRMMAKRNKGVFEPEFRLVFLVITPIFSTVGWFLFGNMAAQEKSPVILSVLIGVAWVAAIFLANSLSNFLVDAFRDISVEIFIASMAMKNFFFFGFSYFINDWVLEWGPAKTFNVIGGIMLAYTVTAIPVYVYGKRLRAWWHLHDLSRKI